MTCFKIADVLIAVLGAYQKLKIKAFVCFSLGLFVFQSILVPETVLTFIQERG